MLLAIHGAGLVVGQYLLMRTKIPYSALLVGTVTLSVLLSPLAWAHYLLFLLAPLVVFFGDPRVGLPAKLIAVMSLFAFMFINPSPWYLVGMIGLIVASALPATPSDSSQVEAESLMPRLSTPDLDTA